MYLKRIVNHLKIQKEIGNLLIKDQITNQLIKGILNVTNIGKRDILNLNANQNLKIE